MTISETDLKLLKSERMTDFEDGGGKMTSNVVVDGEVNNLFNDISQLDRTYGRVSLRKAYSAVHTATTDTYLGSHIILTDPPDDPNVLVTMFSTESWTDERSVAQEYIERYNIKAVESRWKLYGSYILNQMSVTMFSLSNAKDADTSSGTVVPEVGETFVLYDGTHGYEQMFRVTDILYTGIQVFTDGNGDFYKDVIVLAVTGKMKYTFSGAQVPGRYSSSNTVTAAEDFRTYTKVLTTQIADVSEYYGVKKITLPLVIGDLTAKVDSPYNAIVPSSRSETAILDMQAGYGAYRTFPIGPENSLTYSGSVSASSSPFQVTRYLGSGVKTFSVTVTIGAVTLTDDGSGVLVATGSTYGGAVDYASGAITLTNTSSFSGTMSITATPAVSIFNISESMGVEITEQNRRYVYTEALDPNPAPGTVAVDYRALGKWYRLIDTGNGTLSGQGGSGNINYSTGSIAVTFLAMPDFGSTIIYSWGTDIYNEIPTGQIGKAAMQLQLNDTLVNKSSLVLEWTDGTAKTASSDASGNISGDATGFVDNTGLVTFIPNSIPSSSANITVNYEQVSYGSETVSSLVTLVPNMPGSYFATVVLGDTGELTPFSVRLRNLAWEFWDNGSGQIFRSSREEVNTGLHKLFIPSMQSETSLTLPAGFQTGKTLVKFTVTKTGTNPTDGAENVGSVVYKDATVPGTFAIASTALPAGTTVTLTPSYAGGVLNFSFTDCARVDIYIEFVSNNKASVVAGATVDYTTRTVSIPKSAIGEASFSIVAYHATGKAGKRIESFNTVSYSMTASYAIGAAANVAKTHVYSGGGSLKLQVTGGLLPKSLKFTLGGITYTDNGSGVILGDISATTGIGSSYGVVDYTTGLVTLGVPYSSMANNPVMLYSAKKLSEARVDHMVFRVPGAPTAAGSLQIQVESSSISASADFNGAITGDFSGTIDDESGVVSVDFSNGVSYVAVRAADVLYNCVLLSYIPLDPDILGIDTVKLPLDGRVPIYKVGGVGVIHNTQNTTCPNPVTAGTTVSCGRTLLSYAKVFDASGATLPTSKYTSDLDAGTVTFATPLDLTGYTQPLRIEHRIEDMALISDVQITGQVKLMKPVRHAYPANTSYLSSALVIGDLQGRVTNMFDQQTWSSVFSDTLSGSAATASYNDVLYPILTTNVGSIQERWAIVFTGSTAFSCYGEYSGLVATGNTSTDFAPVNPVTNEPYFSLNKLGWGSGWASGNVLRFNTKGANFPIWLARTTLQSDPQVYTDNFKMQIRGDAN